MCFQMILESMIVVTSHTRCWDEAGSASHKYGGDDAFGDSGQGLSGDSMERWVSTNPGALLPGFQFLLHYSVV